MKPLPFRIKICGIKSIEDAKAAVDAGADAIGLNFYQHSRRYVTLTQAWDIAQSLPARVKRVGVFVNAWVDDLENAIKAASLNMVQFHGDETPEYIAQFQATHRTSIMKAFRWGEDGGKSIDKFLNECSNLDCQLQCVLIDSFVAGQYGGAGKIADWKAIGRWWRLRGMIDKSSEIPLVLAGGLSPANVAMAITALHPDAVDIASGVESATGLKDPAKVKAFVEAAKKAFAALGK